MFGLGSGRSVELTVEGMSCGHCEDAVEEALTAVDGVKRVSVSRDDERAEIAAEEDVEADALVEAVRSAGYKAALDA